MEEKLIISDSCIGCGKCTKVCIRGHLVLAEDKKVHEIESPYYCFECGHCISVCPKDAITFKNLKEKERVYDDYPMDPRDLAELFQERRSRRWFDRNCTKEELEYLISTLKYSPTAENSQAIQYAVIDDKFPEFMELLASILRSHTDEHPRLEQFVRYVENGQKEKNNPFTWEGRQLIIAFSRFPIDAIISMEQLELMAYVSGLGGFHSRWILQAAENDPERFMSFFPDVRDDLNAYAVYVIGHPRIEAFRTVPRKERDIFWL